MPEKKKRRRLRRYSFLLTFFVIAALVFLLIFTSGLFFKISEIRVEGVTVSNPREIIELTGFSYGDNIFLINKVAAVRAIIAGMPYARAVRIKRELPGTVVVILTEAAPAAMIEYRGIYWMFDSQGKLLEPAPLLSAPKMPVVKGMSLLDPMPGTTLYPAFEDTAKLDPLLELLRAMQEALVWEDTGEIDISQLSNVRFTYAEKYRVEMGTPEALGQKFQIMLLALEQEQVSGRGPGTLYLGDAADNKPVRFVPDGN
ncbi:MAG: FtsQ-type POTRA domain-containing protein [Oscillospiraceae bacterium]|jgi:hypothetical protein|nr:FtsQ-type POTRA domain-containing protein [Oscillospiraceae bacterium]